MSLATETLKKQKNAYLSRLIQGLLLGGVGFSGGILVLKNGIGKAPDNERSAGAILYNFLSNMMEKGETAEKLVPICFAGFFFILGLIGLYHVIRGARSMKSSNTLLGKSVLHQANSSEDFIDVINAIDKDMSWEPRVFGKVNIGREWILETEAMRLENIKGVFWMDAGMEDYVLCCVDGAQNIWAGSMQYKDQRDDALAYLRNILPEAATGDKAAYVAYLRNEVPDVNETEEKESDAFGASKANRLSIPGDASFIFVKPNGVPTSNFVYEDVIQTLHNLSASEKFDLQPLTASEATVSKISFLRAADETVKISIVYVQEKEACFAVNWLREDEAEKLIEVLMKDKLLPDITGWGTAV